jgi:hypothetical protein
VRAHSAHRSCITEKKDTSGIPFVLFGMLSIGQMVSLLGNGTARPRTPPRTEHELAPFRCRALTLVVVMGDAGGEVAADGEVGPVGAEPAAGGVAATAEGVGVAGGVVVVSVVGEATAAAEVEGKETGAALEAAAGVAGEEVVAGSPRKCLKTKAEGGSFKP